MLAVIVGGVEAREACVASMIHVGLAECYANVNETECP
jgi:hypothetical protein